jgi:hypothetical protein
MCIYEQEVNPDSDTDTLDKVDGGGGNGGKKGSKILYAALARIASVVFCGCGRGAKARRLASSLSLRHPINKLIPLLPTNPPPQPPLPLDPKIPPHNPHTPQTPKTDTHDARDREPGDRDQHPMLPHPEDCLRVLAMPAAPLGDIEEAPLEPLVLVRHEDAHVLGGRPLDVQVLLPDHREEERAGAVHDGDVRHGPVAVVARQALDHA